MAASGPPRVLVTGMFRAGSTRVYNLIREALVARYPATRAGHFGSIELANQAFADPGPCVFKEHSVEGSVVESIRCGDVQAIACIREPLPTMISLCAAFGWSAEDAISETDRAMRSLGELGDSVHVITYRTATDSNPASVRIVLRAVGLSATWAEATRLAYRWSRRRSTKRSDDSPTADSHGYDPVTLLHPGHVGGARTVDDETLIYLRAAAKRDFDARFAALSRRAK